MTVMRSFFFERGGNLMTYLSRKARKLKLSSGRFWWCVVSVIRGVGACNWANGVEVFLAVCIDIV